MKNNLYINLFAIFGFALMLFGAGNLCYEHNNRIISIPVVTVGAIIFILSAMYQAKQIKNGKKD